MLQGLTFSRVYPGFPTPFWGLSGFCVGDSMGKSLWKLVKNRSVFKARWARSVRPRCRQLPRSSVCDKMTPREGVDRPVLGLLSTGEPLCSPQNRRPVQAERSIYPGKTAISGHLRHLGNSDIAVFSGTVPCSALRACRFCFLCFSLAANARSDAFIATPLCSSAGRDAIHALSASFVARCVLIYAASAASENRLSRRSATGKPSLLARARVGCSSVLIAVPAAGQGQCCARRSGAPRRPR